MVGAWFLAAEALTHFWYSSREAKLTRNVLPPTGETALKHIKDFLKEEGSPFRQQSIGTAAMDILKCRFGESLYWLEESGPAAITILKWEDYSVFNGVEGMHNPGVCLAAAGWSIGDSRKLGLQFYGQAAAEVSEWQVSRGALKMRAFSAVFRRFATKAVEKSSDLQIYSERLNVVLAGRRDAPVYIILAYLPASVSDEQVTRLFRDLMDAIFAGPSANSQPAAAS